MELVIAGATDCGTVRKVNEDFFYYSLKKRLVVVCDGMGGHQSGAVASRIAGETMRDVFFYPDLAELRFFCSDQQERMPEIALRLLAGARLANRRLFMMALQDANMRGMGTTLVAMAFNDTTACAVHVGDSRAYQLKPQALQQLTEDHSWVNELLQDHEIRADEVQHFSKKNVLTRALGTHPTTKVDIQWFPLNSAEKFLLCTDGLHNALQPEAILQNLPSRNEAALVQEVERLVQRAKQVNGSDNITAAVAWVKPTRAITVRSKHVKLTMAEEPEPLLAAEERFIKRQYFSVATKKTPPSPAQRMFTRAFPMAAMIAAVALAGYLLYPFNHASNHQATDTPETEIQSTAMPEEPPAVHPNTVVKLSTQPEHNPALEPLMPLAAPPQATDTLQLNPMAFDSVATIAGQHPPAVALDFNTTPAETLAQDGGGVTAPDAPEPVTEITTAPASAAAAGTTGNSENADPSPESLVPQNGGRIFLPGLQLERYLSAVIFANDLRVGPVRPTAEIGFFLPPGVYTIAVKDSTGRLLHQKANINVSKGDVKTLEF